MKRLLVLPFLIALVLSQIAVAQRGQRGTSEEQAIRALDAKWQKAAADRDLNSMVESYLDDAVMMEPGVPAFVGKGAIREQWQRELSDKALALSWTIAALDIRGDMAVTRGRYDVTYTNEAGVVVDEIGKYITVWKNIGGNWRVASEIYNSDGPPKARG